MNKTLIIIAGLALLLAGCTSLPPREVAWQVLNAVDIGQTVTIARQPGRFHETNPTLVAFTGVHPTQRDVYLFMGAEAVLHYAVTAWLAHEDPGNGPWHVASVTWSAITIGEKSYNVVRNEAEGIAPWR